MHDKNVKVKLDVSVEHVRCFIVYMSLIGLISKLNEACETVWLINTTRAQPCPLRAEPTSSADAEKRNAITL